MRPWVAVRLALAAVLLALAGCDELAGINQHELVGEGGVGLDGGIILLESGAAPGQLDAALNPGLD
jgi:hypothetical protein